MKSCRLLALSGIWLAAAVTVHSTVWCLPVMGFVPILPRFFQSHFGLERNPMKSFVGVTCDLHNQCFLRVWFAELKEKEKKKMKT